MGLIILFGISFASVSSVILNNGFAAFAKSRKCNLSSRFAAFDSRPRRLYLDYTVATIKFVDESGSSSLITVSVLYF